MAQKKQLPVEIKALADDGTFEGILAYYNNVDQGGDLIEPGAFAKTIQEKGNERPLLYQHDTHRPIGLLKLVDGPDALRVEGRLVLDIPDGKNTYFLMKENVLKGLSIGYDTVQSSDENGVRHLKELRLWEGSAVTFPMNEACVVTAVKMKDGKVETTWTVDSRGLTPEEVQKAVEVALEVKEGRMLSAATKDKLKAAYGYHQNAVKCMKDAGDIFNALLSDEAGDELYDDDPGETMGKSGDEATSETKAVLEEKSEPVPDHSAAKATIAALMALIPKR